MSHNASNSSFTQNVNLYEYESRDDEPKYVIDFSILFIVGPLFFVFCIFLLCWDYFHGARVVPNCLYFIFDWGNAPRQQSNKKDTRTSHVEIFTPESEVSTNYYTPNRPDSTHSPSKAPKIVERVQNPRQSHLQQQTRGFYTASPSLPPMLEHQTFSYSMMSQQSNTPSNRLASSQPQTQPQHLHRILQKQGSVPHKTAEMKYRDPGSNSTERKTLRRAPSAPPSSHDQSLQCNNVVLSKLSIERRPPPMWDRSYSRQQTAPDDPENDETDDLSEKSMVLKVKSQDMKRRMSTLFPEEDLRRFSLMPSDKSRISLRLMKKTQSCNVILKNRLSHFCPPESRDPQRHSLSPKLQMISEHPTMSKSVTCDVLKSKLGDFCPQEAPTTAAPSSVPTRTPSNRGELSRSAEALTDIEINTESCEGLTRMSTHPQPAAAFNVDMSPQVSKLESELQEIEDQIQKARRRKSFTKEELQAKLQEFVPRSSVNKTILVEQGSSSSLELPSENIDISDLKESKSDIVRSKSSIGNESQPSISRTHSLYNTKCHPVASTHQRSNTWQLKATLYE